MTEDIAYQMAAILTASGTDLGSIGEIAAVLINARFSASEIVSHSKRAVEFAKARKLVLT